MTSSGEVADCIQLNTHRSNQGLKNTVVASESVFGLFILGFCRNMADSEEKDGLRLSV